MKFSRYIILLAFAAISLSGCEKDPETVRSEISETISDNIPVSSNTAESISDDTAEEAAVNAYEKYDDISLLSKEGQVAYNAAIDNALNLGMLPDGTIIASSETVKADEAIDTAENAATAGVSSDAAKADTDSVSGDEVSENSVSSNTLNSSLKCAIADVNADELPELIISHEDSSFMNSAQFVYRYDEDEKVLKCILSEFNGMEFFRSGNVKINWALNQGLAPNIWPFNIYTYDRVKKEYKYAGYVDAWESKCNKTDYEGNEFPTQYDKNKDGVLYSIHYKDEYEFGYIHDDEVLTKLCDEVFGNIPVELSWQ